jgi:hypothetical protein
MKKIIILFLFSSVAMADEFVQFDNGATGWRNNAGVVYGVSGGVDNGSHGFNDVRTGERYENINPNESINTRTGQVIQDSYSSSSYGRSRNFNDE